MNITVDKNVTVIIPNWNGAELLKKHLNSLVENSSGAHVIIVDDHSTDDSVSYIKNNFPSISIVRKNRHEGFASTVNVGVQEAKTDIVILLNTDIEPEKFFIETLIAHFSDPDVFAVGCLEISHEKGKVVLRGRGLAHWVKGYYIHARGEVEKMDTAWVSGGSGAFRKTMWDTLGGMDRLYNPFYWEDIDLSYRAHKAGWKTVFEPKSVVHHYHEEGKIMSEYTSSDVKRIAYRNQYIFIWKNLSDISNILEHIIWTPVRLLQAVVKNDWLMIEGYAWALWLLPAICKKRNFRKGDPV